MGRHRTIANRIEFPNLDIELVPERVSKERRAQILERLRFGSDFTEHMVTISWQGGKWQRGSLQPFGPLTLSPATSALHYGQAIFEGLKAYRQKSGNVAAFRPKRNAERFASSARRLAMPELPPDRFLEAIEALVWADGDWIPTAPETSLYIRPIMFATEACLGVRPANEYMVVIFASPVGAYFPRGVEPIRVWISKQHTRAAPYGTGAAKCAGNYAASLKAQSHAADKGCEQVLYLDATNRRFVEELGGMNFFMVLKSEAGSRLVTPDLSTGTLLDGVTRDSILRLAPDLGFAVEERPIPIDELQHAHRNGSLMEAFACGTAAVITPIGSLESDDLVIPLNNGKTGEVTLALREALTAIQSGTRTDPYDWMHRIA